MRIDPQRPPAKLTIREQATLDFIRQFIHQHGYSPTFQEIADDHKVSAVTVFHRVGVLERKGVIRRSGLARSIEVLQPGPVGMKLRFPIVGSISKAGIIERG